jgi:hypothetical protein
MIGKLGWLKNFGHQNYLIKNFQLFKEMIDFSLNEQMKLMCPNKCQHDDGHNLGVLCQF